MILWLEEFPIQLFLTFSIILMKEVQLQKYEKITVVIKENFIPKLLHYYFLFLPEKLLEQTYELR